MIGGIYKMTARLKRMILLALTLLTLSMALGVCIGADDTPEDMLAANEALALEKYNALVDLSKEYAALGDVGKDANEYLNIYVLRINSMRGPALGLPGADKQIKLYYEQGRYREAHQALMQFAEIYTRQNSTSAVVKLSKLISELEREYAEAQSKKEQEWLASQMARAKERNMMMMLILVLIVVSLAIVLWLFYSRQRLERKNRRLIDEKAEQELNSKNEIIKIQKLQQFQEQRNMAELTRELNEVLMLDEKQMRAEIKRIIGRAQRRSDASGDWVEVEKMMIDSNDTFFENLKREFPNLTKNERKLCTFIHLNLSTKEISKITHQSVGSINIARSRLRRKFGITGDNRSLIAFLDRFKSADSSQ